MFEIGKLRVIIPAVIFIVTVGYPLISGMAATLKISGITAFGILIILVVVLIAMGRFMSQEKE